MDDWSQEDLQRIASIGADAAEFYVANIETGETTDIKNLRRLSAAKQLRQLAE